MIAKLVPHFGTHVTGDRYWSGAVPSVSEVVGPLARGESVKCFGLRRIGKSSLLAETTRQLRAKHRIVIWHDLQKVASIPALLQAIIRALPTDGTVLHSLTAWYEKTNVLPPGIRAKFQTLMNQQVIGADDDDMERYAGVLFEETGKALAATPRDQRPILVFDEVPMFCLNILQAAATAEKRALAVASLNGLLAILRNWRSEEIGVAMALTGSVSMLWLQREHGILTDHINDCADIDVRPMPPAEAEAMVRAMIHHSPRTGWADDVALRLCALLPALYPGVVQYAFQKIRDLPQLAAKDVDAIYLDRIADGLEKNYYTQFDRRFARYSKAERVAIHGLFDKILEAPDETVAWVEAVSHCTAQDDGWIARELLDRLVDDGFVLVGRSSGVRFTSGLVRNWHRGPIH